jgi:hypothetical protein
LSDERSAPAGENDYDEIRAELRRRGYLEGRIERFVLRGVLSAGNRFGRLLGSALRASLIGGPLLGAVLAASAATANRPLLGAADLPLLWLYFAAMSIAGLFLLDLLATGAVVAFARRRPGRSATALRGAWLVGLPTVAYLVLLWWHRRPSSGPVEAILTLVAALLIGILVAWLGGLVSLAGLVGGRRDVPRRSRTGRIVLAVLVLPVAAALFLLRDAATGPGDAMPASAFDVDPRGTAVLFLGVDGLDARLVEVLAPRGAVDGLLGAMERGAVHPLRPDRPAEPPEVWTTLLTGVPASEHGITSLSAERLPGISTPLAPRAGPLPLGAALRFLLPSTTVPVSGRSRRVRTLWEIAALRDPSVAVGWWASWPASDSPGNGGYLVTDRALPKLLAGAPGDRDTRPGSLFDRMRTDFPDDLDRSRRAFAKAFGHLPDGEARRMAWESFLIDDHALTVTDRILEDAAVRQAFVYLPGLDILRDRLARRESPGETATLLDGPQAIEDYVRWLDGRVSGRFGARPGTRTVLVAEPGRRSGRSSEGFIVLHGPGIRPACVGTPLGSLDVAPLSLWLAGFPASREMPGRIPGNCLPRDPRVQDRIATWGRNELVETAGGSDYDDEMLERLRSLGYLQ